MFPSPLPLIVDKTFQAGFPAEVSRETLHNFNELFRMLGIASLHLTTLLLVAPVLLALRRWRLPFGSVTFMFMFVAVAVASVYKFEQGWTLVAAAAGGLVADVLILRWDPSPRNVIEFRMFAAVVPLTMWLVYFVMIGMFYDIGWDIEIWAGSIALSALFGLWISMLIVGQSLPASVVRSQEPSRVPADEARA